eukprot:TRINITY_DN16330_c0_g1_i1.p1 TRINITY_DN16330_c0_g1~~TRINITY_DN16330_c0_g1_i1.p1  ORF type:complete len:378 (-),score=52.01 TRINITY_DN16330_c0_g1_i1:120-1253(-)
MGGLQSCNQCTQSKDSLQAQMVLSVPSGAMPSFPMEQSQTLLQSTPRAREMALCMNLTAATAAPMVFSKCRDGYHKVADAVANFSIEEVCLSHENTEMLSHRFEISGKHRLPERKNYPVFSLPSVVCQQLQRGEGVGGEVGLRSFVSAFMNGVNCMIVLVGMGALPVDVVLDAALTKFTYIFNGVKRDQLLTSVADVVVSRFGPAASTFSGCWFTRLENESGDPVVFLFASSDRGFREAEFLGVSARMLVDGARSESVSNPSSPDAANSAVESELPPDEKGVERLRVSDTGLWGSMSAPDVKDAGGVVAKLRRELAGCSGDSGSVASNQEKAGTDHDASPGILRKSSAQEATGTADLTACSPDEEDRSVAQSQSIEV